MLPAEVTAILEAAPQPGEDCQHPILATWRSSDEPDATVMWACVSCRLRFYPACRECVDLGHRNGHPEGD